MFPKDSVEKEKKSNSAARKADRCHLNQKTMVNMTHNKPGGYHGHLTGCDEKAPHLHGLLLQNPLPQSNHEKMPDKPKPKDTIKQQDYERQAVALS